jgi:hypothetical protein
MMEVARSLGCSLGLTRRTVWRASRVSRLRARKQAQAQASGRGESANATGRDGDQWPSFPRRGVATDCDCFETHAVTVSVSGSIEPPQNRIRPYTYIKKKPKI